MEVYAQNKADNASQCGYVDRIASLFNPSATASSQFLPLNSYSPNTNDMVHNDREDSTEYVMQKVDRVKAKRQLLRRKCGLANQARPMRCLERCLEKVWRKCGGMKLGSPL